MKRETLVLTGLVVVFTLIAARYAAADEARYRDVFSSDSRPERLPALTALPKHPSEARAERVSGETTVCFTVDANGRILRPSVRSSTGRIFERPALKAIRASTFERLPSADAQVRSEACRTYFFLVDALDAGTGSIPDTASIASTTASPAERLPAHLATLGASAADLTVPALRGETICKTEERPGSRIAERVCYTRAQTVANAELSRRTVAELEREAHWRDQAIREAEMKNRYPTGPGLGPR